jgi:hypothetical protein
MKKQRMIVILAASLIVGASVCRAGITPSERGAAVETERYRAEFREGVLTGFLNKLTKEEYLSKDAKTETLVPHLPTGLGTQNAVPERDAARQLFMWPWGEQPVDTNWPNQHFPDAKSAFTFSAKDDANAVLTYKDLTNGKDRFADETFALEVAVDAKTGDLLVTPSVESPRGGVYGCGLTLSALAPEVTVEAPIFEGVRLDRHMQPMLWANRWANVWDYAFVALNGEKTGAVGLWCQDAELKYYKTLFYLVNAQGLSLAVQAMNIPPFDGLKTSKPVTWRMQAFDKSWAQAAARFRDWRLQNVKIAPRPDWVKKLSFMTFGMQKTDPHNTLPWLERFFEGKNLDRVIVWAPDVRAAGFDKNHANNTPYEGFKEDTKKYKEKNLKLMVYLQPMIMWGADPKTDRERQGLKLAREADTRTPFLASNNVVVAYQDQHHLGYPGWQRWFLDWVKEYIQADGANGIYHDQSYICPIDVRGPINGMTASQGMADYFYKAATENPDSIHGTEHMMEVNNVGASLGLGCGILWGTPGYETKNQIGPRGSMNWQRIEKASPVCNALHYPNGAIFAFPHVSSFGKGPIRFHHGMDQVERRGDLPAIGCWEYPSYMRVPFEFWANEMWLDRQRALLFVRNGLRPAFPEDWDRKVLSYFKGANGEDFRYEELPWGSAFAQYKDGKRIVHYARITGVTRAAVAGAIVDWPCYDDQGPAGLDPAITYCLDGSLARPAAWFSLATTNDACVRDGSVNEAVAFMELAPLQGKESKTCQLILNSSGEPKAVWVDGVRIKPAASGKQWKFEAKSGSFVAALLREPPAGFSPIATNMALNRCVTGATKRDFYKSAAFTGDLAQKSNVVQMCQARGAINFTQPKEFQTHIPVKAPADGGDGILRIGKVMPGKWRINGKPVTPGANGTEVPLKAGELALISCYAEAAGSCAFNWTPQSAPK